MERARSASRARREAGSGWLEFAVAAVALSVLGAVLLQHLIAYQALAERTTVELTIMNMRAGMRYRIAELILAGRTREVRGLVGANPVAWLARPPEGYLGELEGGDGRGAIPRGAWYFDRVSRELVYRVNNDSGFRALDGGGSEIRLRVVPGYDADRDGALLGVALAEINRYHWQ